MAMAMAPGVFEYTEDMQNGLKLIALLIDVGTPLLRTTFDKEVLKVNTGGLEDLLLKKKSQLKGFYDDQKKKLYPSATRAADSSDDFDITLLCNLLTKLCGMRLPPKPKPGDTWDNTTEAWIKRLQLFRNGVYGHIPSTTLSETEFDKQWDELTEILEGLGGDQDTISQRKTQPISRDKAQVYLQKFEELNRQAINEITDAVDAKGEEVKEEIGNATEAILTRMEELSINSQARDAETPFMDAFPRHMETFVGREDVFGDIDACLEENKTCLIKGLGGIGKTSLAIEYGHRRAERYTEPKVWER
ncbi:Hypp3326 [Branchiostoma lanceolatum]|uniref:Hypp3326 protein n=1 Tax=Branchiostoma lanceolatum TaxID=7740 RepID=A0A8K0EXI1_BRALA|nr:Hypp3326 [Branchiostoma lanceolatum]